MKSIVAGANQAIPAQIPWRHSEGVLLCDGATRNVLLVRETWSLVELDSVGSAIWNLLIEPKTTDQLVGHLVAMYDVESTRCRRDIAPLLNELRESGALSGGDPSPQD